MVNHVRAEQAGAMTSTPSEPPADASTPGPAPADPAGASTAPPPAYAPASSGPRVSSDQIRDLGRLRRSTADRKVAGVAAGLARHLDVDPVILRVAFVVLSLFGGAGLVLYGACWLLLPEDGQQTAPLGLDDRSRGIALIVAGFVGLAVLLGQGDWFWVPGPLIAVGLIVWLVLSRRNDAPSTGSTTPPPGVPGAGPEAVTPEQRWAAVAPTGPAPAYGAPATYPAMGSAPTDPSAPRFAPQPAAQPAPQQWHHQQAGRPPGHHRPAATMPAPVAPVVRNPRKRGPILFWFTLALAALAVGVVSIVDLAGVDVPGSTYPATVLATTAVMLLVGAFYGRAGGLILVGLLAAAATGVGLAIEKVEPEAINVTPTSAAELSDSYSFDFGDYELDLTQVSDLEALDGRTIEVSGEVGEIVVVVPDGVDVTATASVDGPGAVTLFGAEQGGIETTRTASHDGGADVPELTLDVGLEVGHVEIRTR